MRYRFFYKVLYFYFLNFKQISVFFFKFNKTAQNVKIFILMRLSCPFFSLQDHPSLRGTPLAMLAAQCNKLSNKSPPPLADAAVGKGFHPWKKSPNSPAAGSSGSSGGGNGGGSSAGQHSPCAISAASSSSSSGSSGGQSSRSLSASASTMVNITAR